MRLNQKTDSSKHAADTQGTNDDRQPFGQVPRGNGDLAGPHPLQQEPGRPSNAKDGGKASQLTANPPAGELVVETARDDREAGSGADQENAMKFETEEALKDSAAASVEEDKRPGGENEAIADSCIPTTDDSAPSAHESKEEPVSQNDGVSETAAHCRGSITSAAGEESQQAGSNPLADLTPSMWDTEAKLKALSITDDERRSKSQPALPVETKEHVASGYAQKGGARRRNGTRLSPVQRQAARKRCTRSGLASCRATARHLHQMDHTHSGPMATAQIRPLPPSRERRDEQAHGDEAKCASPPPILYSEALAAQERRLARKRCVDSGLASCRATARHLHQVDHTHSGPMATARIRPLPPSRERRDEQAHDDEAKCASPRTISWTEAIAVETRRTARDSPSSMRLLSQIRNLRIHAALSVLGLYRWLLGRTLPGANRPLLPHETWTFVSHFFRAFDYFISTFCQPGADERANAEAMLAFCVLVLLLQRV